jgi:predicted molibdopterin-dependent oxidoreductase YjgC
MPKDQPILDTSPKVSDEVRKTTCYMCACRCGKGSAGIMQVNAPSRLKAPLKRVGPRGSGEFEEISWEEALTIATDWLKPIREEAPEKLAFFTGRDQSQSFTSLWAQGFGTPNYAAHGGFCSVNMAKTTTATRSKWVLAKSKAAVRG